jgi:hypothetical protein
MLNSNFKFLIVGAGRGGTSLLAGLLDYHPSLEVGFELFSVACLMGRGLPHQGSAIFDERVAAFITACRDESSRYPGKLWGNKITTEQVSGLEDHNLANPEATIDVLDSFFNRRLRDQSIIFILRDGRACVNSKVQRTGQPMETACRRWQYSVKCYKFFKTQHQNNICVRFEDLLLDPEATLTSICSFLKIPYRDEMLNGVGNKKMRQEYQNTRIEPGRMKNGELPQLYLSMIRDDLRYCGYQV